MFAGKKSAQIREILISESAWEEMTCLFAPSLAIGAVVLPFAFYVSEKLALKIMKKETWDNYFGADSTSWGAFIFVYMFCILLSAPLFLLYPAVNKNREGN
ncbi:hypothetical protein [Enterobacter hormaechei]|uniref:hypothetical protein n=1 Tax=Enterobacter hormaechei TaxID=158836 RepID=UPI003D6FCBB1